MSDTSLIKRNIILEWMEWDKKSQPPTEQNMFSFFRWIRKEKAELLAFDCKGDKWELVKSWIQRYEKGYGRR